LAHTNRTCSAGGASSIHRHCHIRIPHPHLQRSAQSYSACCHQTTMPEPQLRQGRGRSGAADQRPARVAAG
jgi:hypothetical protein